MRCPLQTASGANQGCRLQIEMNAEAPGDRENIRIPSKGERIELLQKEQGVGLRGTVFYADHLQILVKWDNGRSQSLRLGVDHYRIIE